MLDIETTRLVIEYIEGHLAERLDLRAIAEGVRVSPYHLHRTFSLAVGLTIHDYLRRRQLTEAAKRLVFSNRSILDIALAAGYESQQAFTRVFTSMYKCPPHAFRRNQLFYPLQLPYAFDGDFDSLNDMSEAARWNVVFATADDIPRWMDLVRLVIDGFPVLVEDEYREVLKQRIRTAQAVIVKDGEIAAGVLLFSHGAGSIDFLGVHPLYRQTGVAKSLLDKVLYELLQGRRQISITTYREGDKADTGHRKAVQSLGFTESELLVEFGYPTQRFLFIKDSPQAEARNGRSPGRKRK